MKRRDFCATGLALSTGGLALAQGAAPVEGRHYKRLRVAQPVSNPAGEVSEFFWYGCPACYALEPFVEQWLQRKPASVSFRRVPTVIRKLAQPHQQLFYALEAMGVGDKLHGKLFAALQVEKLDLTELDEIKTFVARHGVDPQKLASVWNSFSVQTRCKQAQALAPGHEVAGVPWLVVNGRFATDPSLAGGRAETLTVVDHLLSLKA